MACSVELVLFLYVYRRHKLFCTARSIDSSTYIYSLARLWCLHAQPLIYRALLHGCFLSQVVVYAPSQPGRMPLTTGFGYLRSLFFPANFTIQLDDQVELHRHHQEVKYTSCANRPHYCHDFRRKHVLKHLSVASSQPCTSHCSPEAPDHFPRVHVKIPALHHRSLQVLPSLTPRGHSVSLSLRPSRLLHEEWAKQVKPGEGIY